MRLWSLHPKYLDSKGLVALWREGLLAQAVLSGQTRGYRNHPQLIRFLQAADPAQCLSDYLNIVWAESLQRGYRFDRTKVGQVAHSVRLIVTTGQLRYEWRHLTTKLIARAPAWFAQLPVVEVPEPNPLFRVVEGSIAPWESIHS